MGRYSSDSDDKYSKSSKTRSRHRSSSSDSSESRRSRRNKKSRRRSRSKERYTRSRRSRSSSYSKSHSQRSHSRERSKYRRSKSRERYRRSKSRDRTRSRRSRSKSYIREFVSKPKRHSRSSSSDSSDKGKSEPRNKIAVKSNAKELLVAKPLDDVEDCVVIDSQTIEAINEDKFVPKKFSSSKSGKDNIVIDLNKQTIKVPEVGLVEPDCIFHPGLFASAEVRFEKWVKDLYSYRQKALQQGWKNEQ